MQLPGGLGHLTYCQNIHPTTTWAETRAALTGPTPLVKAQVSPDAPVAVGLRFTGQCVEDLKDPATRDDLKSILAQHDYRAITVNGFPYGPFHGTRVKEDVYQPDWLAPERLAYTCDLADLMADIGPAGETLSLSTVPGTYRPLGAGKETAIAENYLAAVAHLVRLHQTTGKIVALAIEPEPFCFLETIAETVRFFTDHLYSDAAVQRVSNATGLTIDEAAAALPRHLGLCYDVCHAAVEFEDAGASIAALKTAGIPVHKLQLSSALRIPTVTPAARAALQSFAEPVYLHQVVSRRDGALQRDSDLDPVLARGAAADGEEWRIHFHVPLFLDDMGTFGTTQDFLAEILAIHAQGPISSHLEVETYTWDVLPQELRTVSIDAAIARELNWVRDRLAV